MFGNDLTLSETIDDDLYWACHSGSNADRLNELIRKGGDVNASVGKNQTKTCLQAAVSGGHLHTVQALLNNGADVNIRAKGGQNSPTPLHTACRHGMLEMAQLLLLEHQANMDLVDPSGNTPADLAGNIHHAGIIKMLNEHKMNLMMNTTSTTDTRSRSRYNSTSSTGSTGSTSSHHRRQSSTLTDGGAAARELNGEGEGEGEGKERDDKENTQDIQGTNNGHGRSTSTDLDMLLAAHRQLTVRESSRDRQLQRIQDSVSNLQSGMHRMVTMVDGLRLLVVESLRNDEEQTLARIESNRQDSVLQFDKASAALDHEKKKTMALQLECNALQQERSKANVMREELEMNLSTARKHLGVALEKHATLKSAYRKKVKKEEEDQETKLHVERNQEQAQAQAQAQAQTAKQVPPPIKKQDDRKERIVHQKEAIFQTRLQKLDQGRTVRKEMAEEMAEEEKKEKEKEPRDNTKIGASAQKRLSRLAADNKKLKAKKKEENSGGLFDDDGVDGLFESNGNTTSWLDREEGGGNVLDDVISTIHQDRQRRKSVTDQHRETPIRRLSKSSSLTTTMVDDLSLFDDDPDDLFGTGGTKTTQHTNTDDLFDFA